MDNISFYSTSFEGELQQEKLLVHDSPQMRLCLACRPTVGFRLKSANHLCWMTLMLGVAHQLAHRSHTSPGNQDTCGNHFDFTWSLCCRGAVEAEVEHSVMTLIGGVDVEQALVHRPELLCLQKKVISTNRDPHLLCATCFTDSFGVHGKAFRAVTNTFEVCAASSKC